MDIKINQTEDGIKVTSDNYRAMVLIDDNGKPTSTWVQIGDGSKHQMFRDYMKSFTEALKQD